MSPNGLARISDADVVSMILLGKRGISSRYVARVFSRLRGIALTAADVERVAHSKVAAVNRAAAKRK
ncbi:MAG: hypothetical protein IPK07_00400 [Deltaproteobacteria bacterium]|nr:hypothetical protein [Deltaproteobacteria bacterium]